MQPTEKETTIGMSNNVEQKDSVVTAIVEIHTEVLITH